MKTHAISGYVVAAALIFCAACGGGRYNYDLRYHPLKREKPYYKEFEDLNYEVVRSDPLKYRGARLGWFGVVRDLKENRDGTLTLLLEYRTYRERHLCEDNLVKSTCRVTVSEKSQGTFSVTLQARHEERKGKDRINYKSLLRVYGTPAGDYNDEGGPVVKCDYYRHWPPGTYVTTAAAVFMRQ